VLTSTLQMEERGFICIIEWEYLLGPNLLFYVGTVHISALFAMSEYATG
jgi:hypothetical protein